MVLVAIGGAGGLAGALAVTRVIASLLFGIAPSDPLTYAAISALLLWVALIAMYLPARRAMAVDPLVALRYE
jgi:ABC-type antimicrobial peptide transport system permease subunit